MVFTEMLALGAGLSMDSFALSITNGMCAARRRVLTGLLCALCYGLFQGSLTTLGYALGSAFADKIKAFDHILALVLLGVIGVKMLADSRKGGQTQTAVLSPAVVFVSAFATSVDALSVGVGLAALSVDILSVSAVIALVSVVLCFAGFMLGGRAGRHLGAGARVVGGLVLIALGVKIFIQHLFF